MESKEFEKSLQKLEEIVKKIEGGDLSLDDSLKLYEDGVRLVKLCQTRLEEAEKKIEIVSKGQDGSLSTKPLNVSENKKTDTLF